MDITYVTDEALAGTTMAERGTILAGLNAYARELRNGAAHRPGLAIGQRCELYDQSIAVERLAERLGGRD